MKKQFCYNIKGKRFPQVKHNKDLKEILEEAINSSIDIMEDDCSDDLTKIHSLNLQKFTRRQQIKILKRLRLAVFEEGNCLEDEDHILEEMLYEAITSYVEVMQDMKEQDCNLNARKEWRKIKRYCCSNLNEKPNEIKDEEVLDFYNEIIWHDLDFQYIDFDKEYIKEYKNILKNY
jgi:hypothetical protein